MENAGGDGFNEYLMNIPSFWCIICLCSWIRSYLPPKKYWWQYISNLYHLSLISITPEFNELSLDFWTIIEVHTTDTSMDMGINYDLVNIYVVGAIKLHGSHWLVSWWGINFFAMKGPLQLGQVFLWSVLLALLVIPLQLLQSVVLLLIINRM